VLVVLAWYIRYALFPQTLFSVGVNHMGAWFLDTFAILASNDALALGRDPYLPNPLDVFQRPHVYSRWWLHLHELGLTRAHTPWVGLALVGAFVTVVLASLRPRRPAELLWYGVVLCSSPMLLAIDRANNDLLVFVLLAAVVPCLTSRVGALRLLAAVPVAIAAGLKFYPAIAGLVLLAGTDRREVWIRALVALALLVVVAASIAPDFARIGGLVPRAEGLMTFGAINLLEAAGLAGRSATVAGLVLAGLVVAGFLRLGIFEGWRVRPEDEAKWLGFVLGALLLTGCFFTSTNYAYRWIFSVWMAPLLWALPRDSLAPARVRKLAGLTAGLLIFVLWSDAGASVFLTAFMRRTPPDELMRWADMFFLIEQPVTWAFFFCLLGFLSHFGLERMRALLARG